MTFNQIKNESLKLDFTGIVGHENKQSQEIDFNPELFNNWLILENKLEDKNRFKLSGLIDYKEVNGWLDWRLTFADFRLTWNNYITWMDWKNGKLVEDE